MKKIFALLIGCALSMTAAGQKSPNIIVFLVDDMGWQDTSLPFWVSPTSANKTYQTPNMERLASEGMKFVNAYAAPVCTPSRTAMLSGMNPARAHITNWTSPERDRPTDQKDDQLTPPEWNYNGLSPVAGVPHTQYATPFPALLRKAGYTTIHVGKAHWGSAGTPGVNPYNMGFEVNISGHAAGHPQSYLASEFYGNKPGKNTFQAVPDLEEYYGSDTFLTEALTLESIKAMDKAIADRKPFFLNLAHYAVHVPLQADKRFYQKYKDAGLPENEAIYASMIEGMDKSLGDVMDYLKKKGVYKNTIIIFMSDNGGLDTPPRAGGENTHNRPLKAGKGSLYEGGIRVPMIVKWQGVAPSGSVAQQYVIIEDFFPTILEMAGVKKYKTVQAIDGESFVPILKKPSYENAHRALVWHHPNKWIPEGEHFYNFTSAIRQGDWKLVFDQRNGKKELYNLADDISETNDLSASNPQKTKELTALLAGRLKAMDAQMPFNKADNKPVEIE